MNGPYYGSTTIGKPTSFAEKTLRGVRLLTSASGLEEGVQKIASTMTQQPRGVGAAIFGALAGLGLGGPDHRAYVAIAREAKRNGADIAVIRFVGNGCRNEKGVPTEEWVDVHADLYRTG